MPEHEPDLRRFADAPVADAADATREVLAHTVEAASDMIVVLGPDRRVRYVNGTGVRLLGARSADDVIGKECRALVVDEDGERITRSWHALLSDPGESHAAYWLRRFDDAAPVHIEAYEFSVVDRTTNAIVGSGCVARDLTAQDEATAERERLAAQARHAQRLERLGVLASGVAHDFNNLLTVVLSSVDLARAELARLALGTPPSTPPQTEALRADLDAIGDAAERASELTRQLLTFGRRQPAVAQLFDVNVLLDRADTLLRRLADGATLSVTLAPKPLFVLTDPVQIGQVLINLVSNARDALAAARDDAARGDGRITITVHETTIADADAPHWNVVPGDYVCLVVRDTGVGIDAETQTRVFEPFFTTKPAGVGTGLGLSMVYGIVTQAGGAVRLDSALGAGATFRVLLPRVTDDEAEPGAIAPAADTTRLRGHETILLVEDEREVRDVTRRVLERTGYRVLEADDGAPALAVWRAERAAGRSIDLVLTDLHLPTLGGRELVAMLREDAPTLPVVYVSGATERETVERTDAPTHHVAKPFLAPTLQRAVREALDAERS